MTFLDLLRLLKHFYKVVLVVVIVGTVATAGVAKVIEKPSYTATATISATDPTGTISQTALMSVLTPNVNKEIAANTSGVSVTSKVGTGNDAQTLTLTATGANAEACVEAVNAIANAAAADSKAAYDEIDRTKNDNQALKNSEILESLSDSGEAAEIILQALAAENASYCDFAVVPATAASQSNGFLKLVLVGFAGSCFIALFLVVLIDLIKRPLKSEDDIKENFELPIIGSPKDANLGNRVWGNVCFALNKQPQEVAIIPAGASSTAQSLGTQMLEAVTHNNTPASNVSAATPTINSCAPINQSTQTLYEAKKADAVIVVTTLWATSLNDVADTLASLQLGNVKVLGVVIEDVQTN
jgi:capsular polysaccharide biosynthesis protein